MPFIDNLKNKLFSSEFFKNVFTMLSATALAQLIPIAISPILTRFYTQKEFGLLGSFNGVVVSLAVIATLKYQNAVMLPKKDKDAFSMLILSIAITLVFSLLLLGFIHFFPHLFLRLFNSNEIEDWLYFIPIAVFLIGVFNTLNIWSSRFKQFKINGTAKVLQSIGYSLIALINGVSKFIFGGGLIVSRLFGYSLSDLLFIIKYWKEFKTHWSSFSFDNLKRNAIKYKDFPLYNSLPSLLDSLSLMSPILLIGKFYKIETLGLYNLTSFVITMPLGFIVISLSNVYLQKFSSMVNEKHKAKKFYLKNALLLLSISIPFVVIILAGGGDLFVLIFGEKWYTSGVFATYLIPVFMVRLTISPMSSIFVAFNKVKIVSAWQSVYFIFTFGSLLTAIVYFDCSIYEFLVVFSINELLMYGLYFLLTLKLFYK